MSKTSKPKEGDAPKVEVADTGGNREEKDGLSAGECAGSDVERESGEQELDKEKLIAGLKEENEKLKKELDELKDIYQRVLAEYANYKRRTEIEKEQIGGFAKSETIKSLLPALDSLERAVEAPPGDDFKKGVEMIIRQMTDILKEHGLEEISPMGETFNPEIHHAVMREDAKDVEPETVTEVYQKGYKIGDRLLRPAMVKVAN